ncbi:uncharacterized protein DNG_07486 [Cephalotrichum gorgonifer]|uniref:Smr domain-containing protein n=1 Tax=Cephalotrichum gorgonifer TaxID=2041049 RepID=A0AAE8SXG1_9PEZI|nr:uncharacterized protein DNG_07486 [Cephalotrichum gorgonifer]
MSQKLIDEFHTRLDEALILAISSEYDLDNAESLQDLRAVLLSLAQTAEIEEASGFNPDGLGSGQKDSTTDTPTDPKSSHDTSQSKGLNRAHESLVSSTTSYDEGDGDGDAAVPRIVSFDDASEEAKTKQLVFMFPSLKQDQVDASLKQVGGDFQAALDHLLTLQFLQSTEVRSKAIDAFFRPEDEEEGYEHTTKKGKKKRRKGANKGLSAAARDKEAELEAATVADILFISERLDLPFDAVAAAYHQNGRSQGKATTAVLDNFIAQGVEAQGDTASARVYELKGQYKKVPTKYLSAIVQVADTIPQWTDDIAGLLESHFSDATKGPLALSYSLKPIDDEVESGFTTVTSKKSGAGSENARRVNGQSSASYSPHASSGSSSLSSAALRAQASTYEQARLAASASAAHVMRRGRSDPLYKQAAVVYAERARENAQKASAAHSQAAHRRVAESRTADCIDLHGVSVSDGVSIAQQAVRAWYDGLGEYRAREARRGFTIITGLGRHSTGGVSRMRQAVCAALVNDGWRMEVGTGKFVVTGRR